MPEYEAESGMAIGLPELRLCLDDYVLIAVILKNRPREVIGFIDLQDQFAGFRVNGVRIFSLVGNSLTGDAQKGGGPSLLNEIIGREPAF